MGTWAYTHSPLALGNDLCLCFDRTKKPEAEGEEQRYDMPECRVTMWCERKSRKRSGCGMGFAEGELGLRSRPYG